MDYVPVRLLEIDGLILEHPEGQEVLVEQRTLMGWRAMAQVWADVQTEMANALDVADPSERG